MFQGNKDGLPASGSLLRVTGKIAEFARPGNPGSVTEIDIRSSTTSVAKVEARGAVPLPRAVSLDPLYADDPSVVDTYLEAREGMLVAYPVAAVLTPTNQFGEYFALRYDRLPVGVRVHRDGAGFGPPMLIDVGGARAKTVKTYDLVPELIGVLHFDFGKFRLEPLTDYTTDDAGWTPTAAPANSSSQLTVASMNCQRLLRDLSPTALDRKLSKLALAIVRQLRSPDLIGVQEVGDLDLLQNLGTRAGNYQAVLLKGCDFSGINVGLLYNPARLRITGQKQLETEAPELGKGRCTLPDGRAFTHILFDRPPLQVDLLLDAKPLTVIVNHWRSQIGDKAAERLASAEFLGGEVQRLPGSMPSVIVLGDFNDWENSEAVQLLAAKTGLRNVSLMTPPADRYSLLFEGRADAFDHILLSMDLALKAVVSGFAHYNSDFPVSFSEMGDTPVRASDHDSPYVHIGR